MNEPWSFIQAQREKHGMHSWEGQRWQYDQRGEPGITYRMWNEGFLVDCLLHYNDKGCLAGILNHYPYGATGRDVLLDQQVTEQPGNVNITLPEGDPDNAKPKLLDECWRRWRRTETPWRPVLDHGEGQHRLGHG